MRIRIIAVIMAAALMWPARLPGANDNRVTAAKAERFFNNGEWASASAMYTLLIAESEADAGVFAHAIVAAEMMGDLSGETRLLNDALQRSMAFDSVMTLVHSISLRAGCIEAYERFLLNAQESFPWLGRAIDRYLLQYYTFRHNGPMMIRYAGLLLKGLPDDVGYLTTLARGYLYANDVGGATGVYRDILTIDPDNTEALTAVGLHAMMHGSKEVARECLGRAYRLRPTPYIASVLKNL